MKYPANNITGRWILSGKKPVQCPDLMTWAEWFQKSHRHVGDTTIGQIRVSTIFLGLDHNHSGIGAPLLFETMIFGGEHNNYQERCATWEQAETIHAQAVAMVKEKVC